LMFDKQSKFGLRQPNLVFHQQEQLWCDIHDTGNSYVISGTLSWFV
jgi:hypothetical protein